MNRRSVVSLPIICCFLFSLIAMTVGLTISSARAEMRLGVDIPADEPVTALAAVMAAPADYNGKTIVMKGLVTGQCASLCEFFFRDGMHTATIYPQGFKFPKLKRNSPVIIYTQVISGQENVVFSALGLRME